MAKDANHPGRLPAALALWRLDDEAPDLVPAFADALKTHARLASNETVPLTREMRECLAELNTQLKPAVRVMADWLRQRQSAEENDVVAVVEALGRLGGDARAEAAVLQRMLQNNRWNARRRVVAALALYRILGDRDLVFPVLREELLAPEVRASRSDPSDAAQVGAAQALGVLADKGDERARALLREAAKGDDNPFVRVAALEALARQKQTNAAAVKGLCAMLRHPTDSVRVEAASACCRLGPLAKSSAKAVKAATEDSELAVRQAARRALEALD
jgi:HEAT repeat protein